MNPLLTALRRSLTAITWVVCALLAGQSVAAAAVAAQPCCHERCALGPCGAVGCPICVAPAAPAGEPPAAVFPGPHRFEAGPAISGLPSISQEIWTPPD